MKWEWTGDFLVHIWVDFRYQHTIGSLYLLCTYNMFLIEGHSLEKDVKQVAERLKMCIHFQQCLEIESCILALRCCKNESFAHEKSKWLCCCGVVIPLLQFTLYYIKNVHKCPGWNEMFFNLKMLNNFFIIFFYYYFLYYFPLLISSYCMRVWLLYLLCCFFKLWITQIELNVLCWKKSILNFTWCAYIPDSSKRQNVLEINVYIYIVIDIFRSHWKWERFMLRALGKYRSMLMSATMLLVCPEWLVDLFCLQKVCVLFFSSPFFQFLVFMLVEGWIIEWCTAAKSLCLFIKHVVYK